MTVLLRCRDQGRSLIIMHVTRVCAWWNAFSVGRGGVRAAARSVHGSDEAQRGRVQATTGRDIRLRAARRRRDAVDVDSMTTDNVRLTVAMRFWASDQPVGHLRAVNTATRRRCYRLFRLSSFASLSVCLSVCLHVYLHVCLSKRSVEKDWGPLWGYQIWYKWSPWGIVDLVMGPKEQVGISKMARSQCMSVTLLLFTLIVCVYRVTSVSGVGLAINRSRVRTPSAPSSNATWASCLDACACHQAV